jgi:hypothetical protein
MPMEPVFFGKGETFLHISGGGGGHGVPVDRAPEDVLDDIREERFTVDYAYDVYGVVIDGNPQRVNAKETERRRAELLSLSLDREHPPYLRHFHTALGIKNFRLVGEREMES